MAGASSVDELRIALTVDDFDEALRFYGDILGLHVEKEWHTATGNGVVFSVERGTLEVVDVADSESIDIAEVGSVVGERVRLAMRVRGVDEVQRSLTSGGATWLGGPVLTPWGGHNARVRTPDGIQLTLFEESHDDGED